jgi:threonine dehydratase
MAIKQARLEFPGIGDIWQAAARISGKAIRTPLLRTDYLDDVSGARVFIKPECLQRTGSFKFRGACNAISAMSEDVRQNGVIAVSSGNHAQGVAEAARLFGVPSTIIMPADAPQTKIDRTRRSGADVIAYDRMTEDRDEVVLGHIERTGAAFIHPFNNPFVIAGQGTTGLEIVEDFNKDGEIPDHVLVCTGGGGLTAGIALCISEAFAHCEIHSCEPEGFDDYRRSLASGKRETNEKPGGSVCDAIVTPQPGEISFAINRDLLADGLAASDDAALRAVAFAFHELKLVVEPGGAIALACLLANRDRFEGKTVVLTLSGGNMDGEMLQRALRLHAETGSYV